MKKAGLMLIFALMVALSFGCSSSNSGSGSNPKETSKEKDEIELKFMMWGNQAHMDMYNKLIEGFTQENPGIKVTMESVPFADYQQKKSLYWLPAARCRILLGI